MLIPIPKKGHTILDPKLRGIAIGPILSRVFDIIINERFSSWYEPNYHQAGFRKGQGCLFQIFCLMLLCEISRILEKGLYIGLFDYTKAFDYLCRPILLQDMMKDRIGCRFVTNLQNVYNETYYVPKVTKSSMGDPMETSYGVT